MMRKRPVRFVLLVAALADPSVGTSLWRLSPQQRRITTQPYGGWHWRTIGALRGGREHDVSGVPWKRSTFSFGSVGGGVWKTTNAGRRWLPIFDSQPIASIGAIAVAASNPNVVYVGSGEAD